MNKIQNIKVLFWDIDNTLLDFDAGAEDSMKQAFSDLGLEFKPEMFDVFQKENPCRIIGTVCIHNIAPAFYGSCEIGYKFSSEFHHMGYATEAVGFCTKLAFNELRMHKVTAVVHPGNVPSMKLLNGLGFVQEGLLRDYLMLHGQWCNHYIYGLVNK